MTAEGNPAGPRPSENGCVGFGCPVGRFCFEIREIPIAIAVGGLSFGEVVVDALVGEASDLADVIGSCDEAHVGPAASIFFCHAVCPHHRFGELERRGGRLRRCWGRPVRCRKRCGQCCGYRQRRTRSGFWRVRCGSLDFSVFENLKEDLFPISDLLAGNDRLTDDLPVAIHHDGSASSGSVFCFDLEAGTRQLVVCFRKILTCDVGDDGVRFGALFFGGHDRYEAADQQDSKRDDHHDAPTIFRGVVRCDFGRHADPFRFGQARCG